MESTVNVVLPVFSLILCGFLAARFRILGGDSTDALNRFVYYFAMPVLLFHVVARLEPAQIFQWSYIAGFIGSSITIMVVSLLISKVGFGRPLAESSLFAMSSVFGNTVYMGIPLSLIAFGEAALTPAIVAGIFQGAFMIVPVIVLIELDVQSGSRSRRLTRDLFLALVRNPLLVAPTLGILWSFTGHSLPLPVDTFCQVLGAAAGPCALFALGLFLYGKPLHEGAVEVGAMVLLKLIVQPIVAWVFLFHIFDVDPLWASVGVLLAALPSGANCFVVAQQYGRYVHRASSAILVSTLIAAISVSVVLNLPIINGP